MSYINGKPVLNKRYGNALTLLVPVGATGNKASPWVHAFIRSLLLASRPNGYIYLCHAIAEARAPYYNSIKAPLLIICGRRAQVGAGAGEHVYPPAVRECVEGAKVAGRCGTVAYTGGLRSCCEACGRVGEGI